MKSSSPPDPPHSLIILAERAAPKQGIRRRAEIYWVRIRPSLQSWKWWWQTAILLGFWVAVGWPIYQTSVARGALHTLLAILLAVGRAKRYSAPVNMQVVHHDYLARKALLLRLVKEMQRGQTMTAFEVSRFQQETLQLIASYVRGHRSDTKRNEIFVNLLVEDGNSLKVVARDLDHRLPGALYPKENMVAWRAIQTGIVQLTGDVQTEYPNTASAKKYKSILALPVCADVGVLGCVSIDSIRPCHFDLEWSELERNVSPYVALLEWTLTKSMVMLPSGTGGAQQ